jgi:hypothetical protein
VKEHELEALLRAAAEADRTLEAPERVEEALLSAYRARHAAPERPRGVGLRALRDWVWAGLAAAAAVVAIVASVGRAGRSTPQPTEAAQDAEFAPLFYADLEDLEAVQVVQVELPRSALAGLGYAGSVASAEGGALRAELLVGNDGIARGIRFVQ